MLGLNHIYYITGFLLCFLLPSLAGAQDLGSLLNKYKHLDPDLLSIVTNDPSCTTIMQDFWMTLQTLQAEEVLQGRFRGSASFSFNSDDAGANKRHQLEAGASVSRGTYPSEIEFSTNIGVTLRENTFDEEVAELGISYDYHHSLGFENYFFAKRYTDNFLGIDQRYEAGGGVLFQVWNGFTEHGEAPRVQVMAFDMARALDVATALDTLASFDAISLDVPSKDSTRTWYQCLAKAGAARPDSSTDAQLIDLVRMMKPDLETLARLQHEALNAVQKRYVRLRFGLLVGLLAELEQATAADSLTIDSLGTRQFFSQSLPGTQTFRWEIRPTFTYRFSDRWRIDIRPYLKFPMPWAWRDEVFRQDPDRVDRRFDFRMDWQNRITVNISDRFLHKGAVSAQLSYRLLYDHAPPRTILATLDPETEIPLLLAAQEIHHILRVSFSVSW